MRAELGLSAGGNGLGDDLSFGIGDAVNAAPGSMVTSRYCLTAPGLAAPVCQDVTSPVIAAPAPSSRRS